MNRARWFRQDSAGRAGKTRAGQDRCPRCASGPVRSLGRGASGQEQGRGSNTVPVPVRMGRPVPIGSSFVVGATRGSASAVATNADRGVGFQRRGPSPSPFCSRHNSRDPRGSAAVLGRVHPQRRRRAGRPGTRSGRDRVRQRQPGLRAPAAPGTGWTQHQQCQE